MRTHLCDVTTHSYSSCYIMAVAILMNVQFLGGFIDNLGEVFAIIDAIVPHILGIV